ncbi:lipoprotein signal peptidase [Bacteroidota bacterium]
MKRPLLIIFIVLLADQILKFWIKTNMYLGQDIYVFGDWFIIHFTQNDGMAFGWKFAGEFGKLALSIFRIIAICAIGWYLYTLTKSKVHKGLIISVSLIMAGAIGNLIDSAFYGLIFSQSGDYITQTYATLFPEGGGYGSFLHGSVVDMLYFPLIDGYYPDWFPIIGGNYYVFFRPVFNIADSSITIGVLILLIFQKSFFKTYENKDEVDIVAEDIDDNPVNI